MIRKTGIKDLVLIEPRVFKDARGYFMESFNTQWMDQVSTKHNWVQDNEAYSSYGVLRGLHYQRGEHAQSKLVRVIQGKVLDVVVDLRKDSPTYGRVFSEILSGTNKLQMLIPRGFAHGYVVLSEQAIFAYKCDNYYNKDSEGSIHPLDKTLNIDWMVNHDKITLSEKDAVAPEFGQHLPA